MTRNSARPCSTGTPMPWPATGSTRRGPAWPTAWAPRRRPAGTCWPSSAGDTGRSTGPIDGCPGPDRAGEEDMSEGEYKDQANKLRELMRTAWLPVTEEGDGPVTGSKFSGTSYLAPGESWPTCPRCGAPMALFLQLDLEALPEELGGELGSGLLQMFYCVSRRDCPIRGEGRLDPFSPYQLLRRVCPSPGGPLSVPPTFDL